MHENPLIRPPRARIEDLDAADRREHVRDPMELVALGAVVLAALVVGANALLPRASGAAVASPSPSPRADVVLVAPRRPATAIPQPALDVRPVPGEACGPLDPTGAYADADFRFTRTVTQNVSLNTDPQWSWCVIGVRAYLGGVEILGRLTLVPDDLGNGPAPGRPHALLRDSAFALAVPGFSEIGPAKLTPAFSNRVVLRYPLSADRSEREPFLAALGAAPSLTLRLVSIDDDAGSYAFRGPPPDPRLTSDHTAIAGQYGFGASPRSLQPAAVLALRR